MIQLFLANTTADTPASPWATRSYVRMRKASEASSSTKVIEATHPDDADLVVFVDPQYRYQNDVIVSRMYRRFRDRAVVFDSSDCAVPVLPGLYVGLNRRWSEVGAHQSGFYLRVADSALLTAAAAASLERDLLFSFIGRVDNHVATRSRVLSLRHPRSVICTGSSGQADGDHDYVRLLARSKFVLAPRGKGVSTWRLFEAMRIGSVPVIVADDWVEPKGVDWSSCSIRVREADIAQIPGLLESREADAAIMGRCAQSEWQRCFSMENAFEWIGLRLEECHRAANASGRRLRLDRLDSASEVLRFGKAMLSAFAGR